LSARFSVSDYITANFPLTPVPTVPEISLHKAGPRSGLWRLAERDDGFLSPYWASWWGGGVGLARHVLDHPGTVRGKTVLDLGSGSGLVAIAASRAGARRVRAADIDPYAAIATRLNAAANAAEISARQEDLISGEPPDVEVILAGDIFYDAHLARRVTAFLEHCLARRIEILVGDPGRRTLPASHLQLLAEYPGPDFAAPDDTASLNSVYRFAPASAS